MTPAASGIIPIMNFKLHNTLGLLQIKKGGKERKKEREKKAKEEESLFKNQFHPVSCLCHFGGKTCNRRVLFLADL